MLKATLTFPNRPMANDFCRYWSCKTLTGHDMSATQSDGSVSVTVYDVDDQKKDLIDAYIFKVQGQ